MSTSTAPPEPSTLAELQGLATDELRAVESYQYLPAPIQEGALHEHAADGEAFTYRVGHAERALREELERRLNTGEIDVTELLGGGSS